VHEAVGADDVAAIDLADGLVAEAYAEDGCGGAEFADEVEGDAGFVGSAGAGGDADFFWGEFFDVIDGEGVVAEDFHVGTELAEVLDEVVGEGVVVIEDEEHKFLKFNFQISNLKEEELDLVVDVFSVGGFYTEKKILEPRMDRDDLRVTNCGLYEQEEKGG
jgi:hypothetical protein